MWTRWLLLGVLLCPSAPAQAGAKPAPLPDAAVSRYGTPYMRHPEQVNRIVWLPDQKRIATRTHAYVFLWDLETGHGLWQIRLPGGTEWFLEYAPPGLLLVQSDNELCFLDETGKRRHTLKHPAGKPFNVAVSQDGKRLVVVWDQGPTILYDLTEKGPKEPGRELANSMVYAPQFTADGNTLIGIRADEVEVWDLQRFAVRRTYRANDHPVNYHTSRISPDGKTLMAVGDNHIVLWKVDQSKEWQAFKAKERIEFSTLAFQCGFTQDSSSFVIATPTGEFRRWSTATGKLVQSSRLPVTAEQTQISPDGKRLAVVQDRVISLWDPRTGTSQGIGKSPAITFSRFVAADRILSTAADQSVHWWEPGQGRQVKMLAKPAIPDWDQAVLSTDGRWWATLRDGNIHIGDLPEGKERHCLKDLNPPIERYTFSRDGNDLLLVDAQGVWRFFDPQRGTLNRRFTASVPSRLDYALDSRRIAAYLRDSGAVAIHDAMTGKRQILTEVIHRRTDQVHAFRFSPSGQYLVVAHGEALSVLSMIYGRVLFRRAAEPDVRIVHPDTLHQTATFSPDERWLILGYAASPKLYLFDLDAACLPDYTPRTIAHPGGIAALHLSPDGKYLVSTGYDGTALCWDTKKLFPHPLPPVRLKERKIPEDWWPALRDSKADELSRLMVAMIHQPDKALALLAERLDIVKGPDAKTLAKWIFQLDSQQFAQRESAMRTLAELGELAEPTLRAALKQPCTVEFKLRVNRLLQRLEEPESQPDRLRRFRAIEVLERIGSPEARAMLTKLSQGAPGARQTVEAGEALTRLKRRGV